MNCGPKAGYAMTHAEIARREGISVRTVMRLEQSALRKLRLSLECIGEALDEHLTKEAARGKAA